MSRFIGLGQIGRVIGPWVRSSSSWMQKKLSLFHFQEPSLSFCLSQLDSLVSVLRSYNSRNLGVIFDSRMSSKQHISELRQSSFFHLRLFKSVKTFIPRHKTLETLVHTFITSRVDWCGLPNTTIIKLQTVNNTCVKFLTGGKKYDLASDKLKDLHWPPVKDSIKFKLLIMTHKIVYPSEDSGTPAYLSSNISIKTMQVLVLRAHSFGLLSSPLILR